MSIDITKIAKLHKLKSSFLHCTSCETWKYLLYLVNNSGETKILERIDTKYKRDTDNLENEKPSEEKIKETIKTSTKEIGITEIETDLSMKTRNKVEKDDIKDKPSKLPTCVCTLLGVQTETITTPRFLWWQTEFQSVEVFVAAWC